MNEKEKITCLPAEGLKCEKCGNWKIITNLVGIPDSGGVYDIHLLCECLTCNDRSRVDFNSMENPLKIHFLSDSDKRVLQV